MIELVDVSFSYENGNKALNNLNLSVSKGEFVFIVGSSGAGKSSLLKLLLREKVAESGKIIVNGYDLRKIKSNKIPKFRRTIGVVFQDFRLISSINVFDNVAFSMRVTGESMKKIKVRVPTVLKMLGLEGKENSYPDQLSGGEQQRVSLARAVVNAPDLLIADEPTGNIDPELSYDVVNILKDINNMGTTVLMVTHEHELVNSFGGRTINIEEGEIRDDSFIGGKNEIR